MSKSPAEMKLPLDSKQRPWRRRFRRAAIATLILFIVAAYFVKDPIRTLYSLRRVPGTNAFVMDYYGDYHLDKIRSRGMDVHNIEDSFIATLFPDVVVPIAARLKRAYVPKAIKVVEERGDHCSTAFLQSKKGDVFFGRNFDYRHDACLILRVHDHDGLASIAVIDLAYLNLNRGDLDQISLLKRLPLLFAPYYAMDGMNRHGVAVSDMSVGSAEPPVDPKHPAIILSTLERIILDYAKDADEAVELVRAFNVHFVQEREHLMIADATGRSRIVEFINGEIRVTAADELWQICANQVVWQKTEDERDNTCKRYRVGSEAAQKLSGVVDYAAARRVARSMSVDNWTMWTSVYNLTTREARVIYKSHLGAEYCDAIPLLDGKNKSRTRASDKGTQMESRHRRASKARR